MRQVLRLDGVRAHVRAAVDFRAGDSQLLIRRIDIFVMRGDCHGASARRQPACNCQRPGGAELEVPGHGQAQRRRG